MDLTETPADDLKRYWIETGMEVCRANDPMGVVRMKVDRLDMRRKPLRKNDPTDLEEQKQYKHRMIGVWCSWRDTEGNVQTALIHSKDLIPAPPLAE